ncbi:MAG TPA: HRDC domain-containing protein [Myxococcota bacterium]|nr:HRDC domain-containing protein [Myxococcota bacterium]HOC99281.1 HRDC domain-containing protein [Myxococcota bacterium]HOH78062.1 HRDC domain-containing protein [Myxococcota bacterium]
MKAKVFTIRWDPEEQVMDDRSLQEFFTDRELVSISVNFCQIDGVPTMFAATTYREARTVPGFVVGRSAGEQSGRRDPREELSAGECVVYDGLREWRNAKAVALGVAGYMILTNRQLAAVSRAMPATLAALGEIEGIGEVRLKEHGQEILDIVRRLGAADLSGGGGTGT